MLTGLSHPRAVTRIPDPIHGSFELTLFDRHLVDTTAFQRLHHVLQQSTMYMSFPANKNTRFPHSIGTAHVSGQLFSASLSNAETGVLRAFLQEGTKFLEELVEYLFKPTGMVKDKKDAKANLTKAHRATISGMAGFLHRPLMKVDGAKAVDLKWRVDTTDKLGNGDFDAAFVIDTLWQALRIYALAHDIGHLPMSHAFEHAVVRVSDAVPEYGHHTHAEDDPLALLSQANQRFSGSAGLESNFFELLQHMIGATEAGVRKTIGKKAVHEIRSYGILNDYLVDAQSLADGFRDLDNDLKAGINDYCRLIHHAALCIIYSNCWEQPEEGTEPRHRFLYAIRQLVDGEIDGDRLDYTLRDCHSSGVDFGGFDLARIIHNALLVRPKTNEGEASFAFGFGPRAVSGIEQFFEARYQSYKYLVHHRTSSRANTVVETLVEKLFAFAFIYPGSQCAKILARYDYLSRSKDDAGDWKITAILPVNASENAEFADSNERLDDANLRSMVQDVRRLFRNPENMAAIAADARRVLMAKEILALSEIFLNRCFSNILTLFKDHSPQTFLRDKLAMDDETERRMFLQRMTDPGEAGRFFEGVRRDMLKQSVEGELEPLTFMYELIRPKAFSEKEPRRGEMEKVVWVQRPSGEYSPITADDISPALKNMSSSRANGGGIRIYVASRRIKCDPELMERAESSIVEAYAKQRDVFRHRHASKKAGKGRKS